MGYISVGLILSAVCVVCIVLLLTAFKDNTMIQISLGVVAGLTGLFAGLMFYFHFVVKSFDNYGENAQTNRSPVLDADLTIDDALGPYAASPRRGISLTRSPPSGRMPSISE